MEINDREKTILGRHLDFKLVAVNFVLEFWMGHSPYGAPARSTKQINITLSDSPIHKSIISVG
jgi:hypothetical protein